ncbi:TonB-dependent receptor [Hellea sp.]|nr:TonB-dependent receptor [Hellea sp.]
MFKSRRPSVRRKSAKVLLLSGVSFSMLAVSQAAIAQDSSDPDEIVSTGVRRVIADAIVIKRNSAEVVDGLSADEIGDLPALSIAEALESITSVGSQREGSGATEVSIRGLGPFLGSTVINGREATNGSGDRSVNFSQFPSELFNKIEVFKTQSASFIEGGVAGQIALSTLKPLDYGKRRVQLQAKGSLGLDNLDIEDADRQVGFRLTGSYVDQWESNSIGDFGISIGGQIQRRPNPEQEARSTSTFQACRIALLDGNSCNDTETFRTFIDQEFDDGDDMRPVIGGVEVTEDNLDNFTDAQLVTAFLNLPSDNNGGDTFGASFIDDGDVQSAAEINPFTGQPFGASEPFVLTSSTRSFRLNNTDDQRDSIFGAAQWAPNDKLDINVDAQYSDRTFTEIRSDIAFDTNDLEPFGDSAVIDGFELVTTSTGALRRGTSTGPVEVSTTSAKRSEEYLGIGGNISYDITENLNFNIDGSYSDTSRREEIIRVRVATPSGLTPIGVEVLQNGGDAHQFTVVNTDLNDTSIFTDDNVEVNEDLNQFRNNTIYAIKGDLEYKPTSGIFSALKIGGRFSSQDYDQLPRVRRDAEIDDNSDFIDGLFVPDVNGTPVVATIELDVGTSDERALANMLGLGDAVGFGTLGNGNDLNNDMFEDATGFIPGTTIPFTVDNNGDFDITATAAQFAALGFGADGDTDTPNEGFSNLGALAAANCANDQFPEDDFLDGQVNGNLITNIDSDGNVIDAGTGTSFATLDFECLGQTVLGRALFAPSADDASGAELVQSVNIREETEALYGQVDYDTSFEGLPIRGNFGLRYVHTTVRSDSFRSDIEVDVDGDGNVTGVSANTNIDSLIPNRNTFTYDEFLPSANFVMETTEDTLFRAGVFRAISRPDPSDLGNGRSFNLLDLDDPEGNVTVNDFIGGVVANGNPNLAPFTSWNYDGAIEWYPNEDSILALGVYYKTFDGGFQNSLQTETFTINGQDVSVDVPVLTTTDESSNIAGFEATASHAFSYLPGLWSGLGFKVSYNYADSDFEFEDGQFGEAVSLDENGEILTIREGFIAPANLVGLSKHTASGQVYYDIGDASFSAIGKYRSEFFQQFISTPLNLRYIDDAFVLDARASYKINDNFKVSVEALNILNTERQQFNPTTDNFAELNVFGPRVFLGITGKF